MSKKPKEHPLITSEKQKLQELNNNIARLQKRADELFDDLQQLETYTAVSEIISRQTKTASEVAKNIIAMEQKLQPSTAQKPVVASAVEVLPKYSAE